MVTKRAELRDFGSKGFVRFADLPVATVPQLEGFTRCSVAPRSRRVPDGEPGGRDSRDPSVFSEPLATARVNGAEVVYFGNAAGRNAGLTVSIAGSGTGGRARHWAGR